MSATKDLMLLDPTKTVVPWDRFHRFSHRGFENMQDPTGIHVEEGDFLYGLIRILKPLDILETGTNIGISTQYMALALRDNDIGGMIHTIEHSSYVAKIAKTRMEEMRLDKFVTFHCCETGQFFSKAEEEHALYDFVWLDTEFRERYAELVWTMEHLRPGGVVCIHDLWELDCPEYGGVPETVRSWLRKGFLRAQTFDTHHGLTVFQKRRDRDHLANIQSGLE